MNKPLVYLACGLVHQDGVESVLQRLGLNVERFEKLSTLLGTARRRRPDLVLLDAARLRGDVGRVESDLCKGDAAPLVVLIGAEDSTAIPFPHVHLNYPLEPLALHQLLRERVKNYSRLHVRIETALPGLFAREQKCQFCEIINLSAGGAFIKTGSPLGASGEEFRLYIPLLGMKREIELCSEVVFQVTPNEDNNYQQGAGVRFRQPDAETTRHLEDFLRRSSESDAVPGLLVNFPSRDGGSEDKAVHQPGNGRARRVSIAH